ncbi:MAG: BREX-1 system adenine-specific DNA-methyltransferase PglX [Candidatus Obscuribacterales bacterium]|nr:BREX-1 system adenine-specific DNA-methyltransferase PglX [Candidatus Obscuribacterales bacterium]
METTKLRKYAQFARRELVSQVASKLKLVLAEGSDARREQIKTVAELEKEINSSSEKHVIEKVAYTWFNRFCALRFMDANRYTAIGIVSPTDGQFQPEILAEAKMGHVDELLVSAKVRDHVFDLLSGTKFSTDAQGEAYRALLVSVCNYYHLAMPYLFEKIAGYAELLMPDDLLSSKSILAYTREALTPDVCADVEVIGWLYQFYISEKKDEVFEGLKNNNKISVENLPAATQLFTPRWIVRYLVENSLGRLWMLNHPNSKLVESMDYYVGKDHSTMDFLQIRNPEDVKICDPACGSGHMLVYAFDLLYAIYEEQGYERADIPYKILQHNLVGIEIDERAAELAAFALTMKARSKYRSFFRNPAQPKIIVLKNVRFDPEELKQYTEFLGKDVFSANLRTNLQLFGESDNFGSLICPEPMDSKYLAQVAESKNVSSHIFLSKTHEKVLEVFKQIDCLSESYNIVIANPPYMGGQGMNGRLSAWAKENYPNTKADLFAMFMERALDLVSTKGLVAMVTMQSWMFLSSFYDFRKELLDEHHISSLIQIGFNSFPELNSKVVQACAFVITKGICNADGIFFNLNAAAPSADKNKVFLDQLSRSKDFFFLVGSSDFKKIPGFPIAYWISNELRSVFPKSKQLGDGCDLQIGMITGKNDLYLRQWYEVSFDRIGFGCTSRENSVASSKKWFPYAKGGDYRKWAGNEECVVDWEHDGERLRTTKHPTANRTWAHNFNLNFIFLPSICWTVVTSMKSTFRLHNGGFLFDAAAGLCQPKGDLDVYSVLGLLNSKFTETILPLLNQTMNMHPGYLSVLPQLEVENTNMIRKLVEISKQDWDSFETSWNFQLSPLLDPTVRQKNIRETYEALRAKWEKTTEEMRVLEQSYNERLAERYKLQAEVSSDVTVKEITINCNPAYRYGDDKNHNELESLLLADTIKELASYAVGCMFGRYSLDKPGLIMASQGQSLDNYSAQVQSPQFEPDTDNAIPVLDGDWFNDDLSIRFRKFVRIAFGEEYYEDNIEFIEHALGKDIRKYFLKDFYNDHVRRYKKRPLYWLFSSPNGSFNILIYGHRYKPDTVSVVLNDYLREFRTKLMSKKSHLEAVSISGSAAQSEKTKAFKEIEMLRKIIDELNTYEREVLYPLATKMVDLDLDDGVKTNYGKLGPALKSIPGFAAAEE